MALLIGPFLATVFNGFARAATGDPEPEVPTVGVFGFDLAVPGVRITLWLAAIILMGAGVLAGRSMKLGLRAGLRDAMANRTGGVTSSASRSNHPTSQAPSASEALGEVASELAEGFGIEGPTDHVADAVDGPAPTDGAGSEADGADAETREQEP